MRCEEGRMKDCDENWMIGEWEKELPAPEELMPLTQTLITPDLAAAFKIERDLSPTESASAFSQSIGPENLQTLLHHHHQMPNAAGGSTFGGAVAGGGAGGGGYVQMGGLYVNGNGSGSGRADSGYGGGAATQDSGECGAGKKPRKQGIGDSELEEADSGGGGGGGGAGGVGGGENSNEEPAARTLKRPRLVWTPQLHKRFVDAVAHLGIKNAVPKTIMQLMNVEGLTRENVASHLQKYRLYLKRMQGLSSEGPSASDQLFASTPVPPSLTASAHFHPHHAHREDMLPLAFSSPVVPMAVAGLGHGHMVGGPYTGFDHHFFNSLSRQPIQRISPPAPPHPQDYMMEAQTVASSPPRKVLTLFPTGGN